MKTNFSNEAKLSPADVRRFFSYDPLTGILTWCARPEGPLAWNTRWAGKTAGFIDKRGYVNIDIYQTTYQGHRLAWLHANGHWPRHEIDHIDGNPSNNALANLREATHEENLRNTTARRQNSTGLKNITKKKWGYCVSFIRSGERLYEGHFGTLETAIFVRELLAPNVYGNFDRNAQ